MWSGKALNYKFPHSIYTFPIQPIVAELLKPDWVYLWVQSEANLPLVSSPGRDSRDSRSSRLAEATQKALVQTHFELVPVYLSGSFPTFIQYLENLFLKSLAFLQYYVHFS